MGSLSQNLTTCYACAHVGWRKQPCAGACPCMIDGRDLREHAQDNDCPKGFYREGVPERPKTKRETREETGRRRWAEYHARALAWDGTEPATEADYRAKLADGMTGCTCAEHWSSHVAANPFTATTAEEYHALSMADHDAVNVRLGKAPFTPSTS